ncbi:MAG: hypothetical protein AAF679_11355 [Pseudomonadota bacterium]
MNTFINLLRMDQLASRHGCGLHPKFRVAIEAELAWPAKAASPETEVVADELPENVVRFELRHEDVREQVE